MHLLGEQSTEGDEATEGLRVVAGGPAAQLPAPLTSCLGRVWGYVAPAQSREASTATLFQFLFPGLCRSTYSLPNSRNWNFPGSPMVHASNAGDAGSIPGEGGTKIPHEAKKEKKKKGSRNFHWMILG